MTDFFSASYRNTPPWEIGEAQPALVDAVTSARGRLLDIGCGTGELAMLAAARGLEATGVDSAATAIEIARQRASDRRLDVDLRVGDALDLPQEWSQHFDMVVDSGVFHVFSDADRVSYVRNVGRVVKPGGGYAMLCFSDREPGDWGPRRISEAEIRAAFAVGWTIEAIEPATFELNSNSLPGRRLAAALRARMTRN